jgi:hypothetical protein
MLTNNIPILPNPNNKPSLPCHQSKS